MGWRGTFVVGCWTKQAAAKEEEQGAGVRGGEAAGRLGVMKAGSPKTPSVPPPRLRLFYVMKEVRGG